MPIPVQHNGDYVLTSDGNKDFGEITDEIAKIIHRESGKIRLEVGFQKDGHGYGEKHIERPDRLKQLKNNGFENARDFIQFITKDYDAIFQGQDNNIVLVKEDSSSNIAFLALKQNESDKDIYWSVESAFISRKDYLKNKTPLWEKPNSGIIKRAGKGAVQSS